ncbi:MAG: helix-turn-helix domain-containing protein [Synergistaceae bacterium]|jgi:transcriptional regulator with XRE-family HTH domain|nr:helix-turn-helix domain-containing protein [Synergistaceae bacterium]
MSIGSTIKKWRTLRKFTQPELADAVGVATQTVLRWEKDHRVPNLYELEKISNSLDISIILFLEDLQLLPKDDLEKLDARKWYVQKLGSEHPAGLILTSLTGACEEFVARKGEISTEQKNLAIHILKWTLSALSDQ